MDLNSTKKIKDPSLDVCKNNKQAELHKKDLSLEVPSEYFATSKKDILNKTVYKKEKNNVIKMIIGFSSVAAILGVFYISLNKNTEEKNTIGYNDLESELLISSLFVSDQNVDAISDVYMLDLYDE